MRIIADTHTHTLASGHAFSTINEMIQAAKDAHLELIAITEHAPTMPGSCHEFYFSNLKIVPRDRSGIDVLFGVELNIMDAEGHVDLPESILKTMDIGIASVHPPCFGKSLGIEKNTEAYLNAMKNPWINIMGHPVDGRFPVDMEELVKGAKREGVLLELNNTSLSPGSYRLNSWENALEMLKYCEKHGAMVSTGSDAHVDAQVGKFDCASRIIEESHFPEELVATTSLAKLKPYLNRYKKR